MYDYRNWSPEKQKAALAERVAHQFPLHSPPHIADPDNFRIITGACYEHKHILNTPSRLAWFEQKLLEHINGQSLSLAAWAILPNHYHLHVKIPKSKHLPKRKGNFTVALRWK